MKSDVFTERAHNKHKHASLVHVQAVVDLCVPGDVLLHRQFILLVSTEVCSEIYPVYCEFCHLSHH